MQSTDKAQCVTVLTFMELKLEKTISAVKLFVTVSFNCFYLPARFLDHINIREFREKKTLVY